MRRWVIADKATLEIATDYLSDKKEQGTNKFGGPWDSPNSFLHLKVPKSLEQESLANLEAYEGDIQCECNEGNPQYNEVEVIDSHGNVVMIPAYNANDEPILDANGDQVLIIKKVKVPISEPGIGIRKKA
jgi:hypothetical protein